MNIQFRNNLQKDDRVLHAETKRPGTVRYTPEEGSRTVGIVWQGTKAPQYVDVMKLRLVVDGKPEDVPPVDGEPPAMGAAAVAKTPAPSSALDALKAERETVTSEMKSHEDAFRVLKQRRERLDAAITALTAPNRE